MREKAFFFLFVVVVCVLGASSSILWSAGGAKVRLTIQTSSPRPFHKELYGFNTNMMHGIYAYTDRNIIDLVSVLRPTVLRFPGGTVANFYHWKQAGFNRKELETAGSDKLNRRLTKDYEKLQSMRKGILSFDDFMALCNKFNIRPLIVLNLYTGSPGESAEWARYVRKKGYKVWGWELGNELTIPYFRKKIRDADDYISIARKHVEAIKAVDPGARFAVIARPFINLNEPEREDLWNEKMARQTFFDAFTVHPYLSLEKLMGKVRDRDIEKVRDSIFEASDAILERVAGYKADFSNREMWVTEWNMVFRENVEMADTLLHALFCGDFFIKMANIDMITHADYHVLAGPWNGFPVLSPGGNDPEKSINRACYYSFQIIREAVSRSDKKFQLTVENNPVLSSSSRHASGPVYGISAVSVGQANKVLILITNRTSADVPYNLVLNNKQVTGNVRYLFLTAKSLGSKGKDKEIETREKTGKADSLVLPANSFGLIELL